MWVVSGGASRETISARAIFSFARMEEMINCLTCVVVNFIIFATMDLPPVYGWLPMLGATVAAFCAGVEYSEGR